MPTRYYNKTLTTQMRICRYAVYGYFVAIHIFVCYQSMSTLEPWLVLLLVLPALVHTSFQLGPMVILCAHVAEAIFLPALLFIAGAPQELVVAAVVSVAVCNALLFGGFAWPAIAGVVGGGGMLWIGFASLPSLNQVPMLVPLNYGYVALLIFVVATIANRRTVALAQVDARLKKQNALLKRYLPEDIWPQHVTSRRSHRAWTTILFIDLCGFSSAVERLSPELVEEFLNDFLGLVTASIREHQGSVHKFLGDGVLCVFRAPSFEGREAFARLGLDAAQAVGRSVVRLNQRWQARGLAFNFDVSMGLASGHCTIGDWGSTERMDYSVVGGAVNLASRLQDKAPAGKIYLDETTATMVGDCQLVKTVVLRGIGRAKVFAPLPGWAAVGNVRSH